MKAYFLEKSLGRAVSETMTQLNDSLHYRGWFDYD